MGAVGTWAGCFPRHPERLNPGRSQGASVEAGKGVCARACVRVYVHPERLNPGRNQGTSVEAGKGVCARACVRVCMCTGRGSTQGGVRAPLCRLERVCVCVRVCVCDENETLSYFLIHHPARQESQIASRLGVSRLVKKLKLEFISVSAYIQTNLLLLCFTFLCFTDIADFSFFPY